MKNIFDKSFSKLLKNLERIIWQNSTGQSFQNQIFILGLPRTGTTLVYQYLVHRLHLSYLTNGVGKYPEAPCLVTWFQHKLYGDYVSDFQSNYGKVKGPVAPREAGTFWARFFGYHEYKSYNDISQKDVELLRSIIFNIQKIFGGVPFINKNVKHMLRLDALEKIFSNSLFLIIERDLDDVALSLFRARKELLANPEEWWSVRPTNYELIKDLPPYKQVAIQVNDLKEKLEEDLKKIESNRIVRINYTKFCQKPEKIIHIIKEKIPELEKKNKIVENFTASINKSQNAEEKKLLHYLNYIRVK